MAGRVLDNWRLIAANLLFGANFSFFVSLTHHAIDFRTLFILQVLCGAICFIPHALVSPNSYHLTWRDALRIVAVSGLVIYGWMYLLLWGSSYTHPIDAAVIASLGPAITLLADRLLNHGEHFNRSRVVGIVASFIGAWLLIFDKGFSLIGGSRGWGNLLVFGAIVAIATNTVIIKPQLERLGARAVMGWLYLIGLIITLPLYGHRIDLQALGQLPLGIRLELLYILLPGTVWPMWLLYRGAEQLTAVHTALYRYIQPLSAGIVAHIRHQATFDATNITALLFILVGVILTVIGYRRSIEVISGLRVPRRPRQRR